MNVIYSFKKYIELYFAIYDIYTYTVMIMKVLGHFHKIMYIYTFLLFLFKMDKSKEQKAL